MRYMIILALLFFTGCAGGYEKADDAQDAGREFIRASLDGDYKKARFYMLQDTTNALLIDRQKRDYEELNSQERQQHRGASIRPISIDKMSDTATVYKYFTTYNTKDTTSIMIVKFKGDWLVDLKSILRHDR